MSTTYYNTITANMDKRIQQRVEGVTWKKTKLWKWFNSMPGLVEPMPKGLTTNEVTIMDEPEGAKIISDVSDLPNNTPKFLVKTSEMAMIGMKLSIPFNYIDRWRNNQFHDIGVQQVIDNYLQKMAVQVDAFIAWGDKGGEYYSMDDNHNLGYYKGLFNSGTTIGGGAGADDDTSAAGDYIETYTTATLALKNAGYEVDGKGYWVFSDSNVVAAAKRGNNLYKTYNPLTEYDSMIATQADMAKWIDSPNLLNRAGTEYYMLTTNPYKNRPMEGETANPAYRLRQGYNFDIYPLHNGGLSGQSRYEWAMYWSGILEVIDPLAIQVTGALTLS